MKVRASKHCKGCKYYHSAKRNDGDARLKKYDDWCCRHGGEASKAIGHCKLNEWREAKP